MYLDRDVDRKASTTLVLCFLATFSNQETNATLTATLLNRIKPDIKTILAELYFWGLWITLSAAQEDSDGKEWSYNSTKYWFLEGIDLEATSFLGLTYNPFWMHPGIMSGFKIKVYYDMYIHGHNL